MGMGRKRTKDRDMPARVYFSRGWWFYVSSTGKWIKLGKDKVEALRAYADMMDGAGRIRMAELFAKYRRDVLPTKATSTRATQELRLAVLEQVFGKMAAEDLNSGHVAGYLDESSAKIQANRDIALLSHVFTKAIRWRLCSANPCLGVERNPEKPRERYIEHEEFLAVYEVASPMLKVMMGLGYITGQRETDLLKLRRDQVKSEGVYFRQGKTGKRLIVAWSDALGYVMELANHLPSAGVASLFVVCRRDGQPYSGDGFRSLWQRHMRDCLDSGQISERFTFHDIRAKAGSDAKDGRLLGHLDPKMLRRVYQRKPEMVSPVN